MRKYSIVLLLCVFAQAVTAHPLSTKRIQQLSNNQVTVWKTIIYPGNKTILSMHRHDNDRVLVALSNGLLKITNDKGHSHYLKLKKDTAYFLSKDVPNELHTDQNLSPHAIKVMVIELNNP